MSVWTSWNPLTVTLFPWALAVLIALAIIYWICHRAVKPKDKRPRFTANTIAELRGVVSEARLDSEERIVIFTHHATWNADRSAVFVQDDFLAEVRNNGIDIEWRPL